MREKYTESEATMRLEVTRADVVFDLLVVRFPRHGAKLFIGLRSVCNNLGFRQFGGDNWRWVNGSRRTWARVFSRFGLPGHLQVSFQCKPCHLDDQAGTERFLPMSAVSMAGLLLLACMWAWADKRSGGMTVYDHRTASSYLIRAFCDVLAANKAEFSFPLDISKTSVNSWLRPSAFAKPISLILRPGGVLDLSEWARLAAGKGLGAFCASAHMQVKQAIENAPAPLISFLEVLSTSKEMSAIFQQVVTRLGAELQRVFLACMGSLRIDGLRVKPTEVGDIFEVPPKLQERLARNMASCVAKSQGDKCFSICSDKAAVGGFNSKPA